MRLKCEKLGVPNSSAFEPAIDFTRKTSLS